MDFRYLEYLNDGTIFYEPSKRTTQVNNFTIKGPTANFKHFANKNWSYFIFKENDLPDQGWKIHLTSPINEAQKTLNKVSPFLLKKGISFKFVPSKNALTYKNSKYGDRASSGKFVTIYPRNEEEFLTLLPKLAELTKNVGQGAYILNDKQWYSSNVFFRYGAFKAMPFIKDNKKLMGIKNLKGQLIPDLRVPFYTLPDFIKEPKAVIEMDQQKSKSNKHIDLSAFKKYQVQSALHFSNGGGVYLVTRNNQTFVMKEGRKQSGIDAKGQDGFQRVKNEFQTLTALKDVPETVNAYDYFEIWENNYLIEDFIEGISLADFLPEQFPFSYQDKRQEYLAQIKSIVHQLKAGINKIHQNGLAIGDLNPNNIMIDKKGQIKLIDFESSSARMNAYFPGLQTPGYVCNKIKNFQDSDWFAFCRIIRFSLLPIEFISDISPTVEKPQDKWISRYFGNEVTDLLSESHNMNSIENLTSANKFKSVSFPTTSSNLPHLISGLQRGILNYANLENENFARGDINQFIQPLGKVNIANGGFGMIMALNRSGNLNNAGINWAKAQTTELVKNVKQQDDNGLFSGISGLYGILSDLNLSNEKKQALMHLLNHEKEILEKTDYSLYSGLSGIGIALLGAYSDQPNHQILEFSQKIAIRLKYLFSHNSGSLPISEDIIPHGLLFGWAGTCVFMLALAKITHDNEYLQLGKRILTKEIENEIVISENQNAEVNDSSAGFSRLLPYLGEGGVGVGLILDEYLKVCPEIRSNKYINLQTKFHNNLKTYCTYTPGLTRGIAGIILAGAADSKLLPASFKLVESLQNYLLCDSRGNILTPGNYGYRFSNDLFTGNAGLLMALVGLQDHNPWLWFPLPRPYLNSFL